MIKRKRRIYRWIGVSAIKRLIVQIKMIYQKEILLKGEYTQHFFLIIFAFRPKTQGLNARPSLRGFEYLLLKILEIFEPVLGFLRLI